MKRPLKGNPILFIGIFGPIISLLLVFLDIFLSPWFSWSSNALSDLGVAKYGFIFNGSLIFEAIINTAIFLYIYGYYKSRIGFPMVIIAGISLGLVGIFNEHYHPFHTIFALIYFILFPLGIVFLAPSISNKRPYRISSILIAILALIVIVTGVLISDGVIHVSGIGLAIPETVEAALLALWIVITFSFIYIGRGGKISRL